MKIRLWVAALGAMQCMDAQAYIPTWPLQPLSASVYIFAGKFYGDTTGFYSETTGSGQVSLNGGVGSYSASLGNESSTSVSISNTNSNGDIVGNVYISYWLEVLGASDGTTSVSMSASDQLSVTNNSQDTVAIASLSVSGSKTAPWYGSTYGQAVSSDSPYQVIDNNQTPNPISTSVITLNNNEVYEISMYVSVVAGLGDTASASIDPSFTVQAGQNADIVYGDFSSAAPVPLPPGALLFASGLAGLLFRRRQLA
jgi:hypothetical protein